MSSGTIASWFDEELARAWDVRLGGVDHSINGRIQQSVTGLLENRTYSQRLDVFANAFQDLPGDYAAKCEMFASVLGPENTEQDGMFSNFYWLLPVSRFVQNFGTEHLRESLTLISELTKRSTGEYAIRPLAQMYPDEILEQCRAWAMDDNFHLRRLASEGIRPNLPWASKLTVYLPDPRPVLQVLDMLVDDDARYVRNSVANHASDYLRVAPDIIEEHVDKWRSIDSKNAAYIVKRFDARAAKRRASK